MSLEDPPRSSSGRAPGRVGRTLLRLVLACLAAACGSTSSGDAARDSGGIADAPREAKTDASPSGKEAGPSDAASGDDASHRDAAHADGGSPFVLGWYEGASCTCDSNSGGPGNIDTFAAWLGSPITIGSDYSATDSWSNWAFPGWQSAGWQAWRKKHPGYRLVLAPGFGVAQDLAGGAAGMYDTYWQELGQALVAANFPDAILRIAHEFNGNWYWYQPQGQEAAFIGYWQHAVKAMRSVKGQKFTFFWNPTLGVSVESGEPFDAENAYPGDDYVDYIGPDTYDSDWGVYPTTGTITASMQSAAWNDFVTEDHGLTWFSTFATSHKKPLAVAEWGLWAIGSSHGGGDDPAYVQHMHDWLVANHVAFADYFDSGSNQIYPGGMFPNGLSEFKKLF